MNHDFVRLTDTFVEQLMCELLVLVASNAIVIVVVLFCSFSMALGHTDDIT